MNIKHNELTKKRYVACGQQVFLDKFTFSCVWSTSFPSRVSMTSVAVRVHGMLLNIYLTSRPPNFLCQNHRSISCTFVKFSLAFVHTKKTRTNFPCPKAGHQHRKKHEQHSKQHSKKHEQHRTLHQHYTTGKNTNNTEHYTNTEKNTNNTEHYTNTEKNTNNTEHYTNTEKNTNKFSLSKS